MPKFVHYKRHLDFPVFDRKHYKEYLVSLINSHSLDPAVLYDYQELLVACDRYQVDLPKGENEEDTVHAVRLLKVRLAARHVRTRSARLSLQCES